MTIGFKNGNEGKSSTKIGIFSEEIADVSGSTLGKPRRRKPTPSDWFVSNSVMLPPQAADREVNALMTILRANSPHKIQKECNR